MVKLVISGCNGHMGKAVARVAADYPDVSIVAGFDVDTRQLDGYPVYASPADFTGDADVIVDFSSPEALQGLLEYGISKRVPLVLCTTGYSPEQIMDIENAASQIPVFRSGNMSLGINLLANLVRKACAVLGGAFDVEIVERHHKRKVDAPSGTALMLANAASSSLPYDSEIIFERQSRRKPRDSREIGVSAIRGGSIVGDHEVIFAGQDEVIELKHSAASRDIFATGAISASKFMANVGKPGLYDMSAVL